MTTSDAPQPPEFGTDAFGLRLVRRLFELARDEDLGEHGFDATGEALGDADHQETPVRATLGVRQAGVVAGLAAIPMILDVFGCDDVTLESTRHDGDAVQAGDAVGVLHGPKRALVRVERTVLNTIGRLSGIATLTRTYVDRVEGTGVEILDTRKTTPGLRVLEKYAVRCGGGVNHRMGLHDAVLIKDNHLAGVGVERLAAHVGAMVRRAHAAAPSPIAFVQVEVDTLAQLEALLAEPALGVDLVLLDNMDEADLRAAVKMRNLAHSSIRLEASGGVRLDTVAGLARTGVDRISIGGLTHQAASLDVGLDMTDAEP